MGDTGTQNLGLDVRALDLRIENVGAAYGSNVVLDGIDLTIEPGELFALLGPSGCGKTTLLRLIAGFADASHGRVLVGGKDISPLQPWKRDVGMVFQSYALWPHMTVRENVAFGLRERRLPRAEIRRRVEAALAFVKSLTPAQVNGAEDKTIAWTAGGNDRKMKGNDYLQQFGLPNFYFFVTTAYAILRHRGVPVGKRDFLGPVNWL